MRYTKGKNASQMTNSFTVILVRCLYVMLCMCAVCMYVCMYVRHALMSYFCKDTQELFLKIFSNDDSRLVLGTNNTEE